MKKFGLYLGRMVRLVDCETGEIVACGAKTVNEYLKELGEENYTLKLIQCLTNILINGIMDITKERKR